ncbi:MAG: hypothetical protein FJ125_03535, partial [Deltaproteobacteria bacterium]|nr:hypothetical protein [Deltaproteobacteria bacterium]
MSPASRFDSYGPFREICDAMDNDCDGATDNTRHGCECVGDQSEACSRDVGVCRAGVRRCVDGFWGPCDGTLPRQELCNGLDDDCDGHEDNNLTVPEDLCLTRGVCAGVLAECRGLSGWVCPYPPSHSPGAEDACDRLDNDCNGQVDDVARLQGSCECINDETRICGSDVGECSTGIQRCLRGEWDSCEDEQLPVAELCNGLDDDCDGRVDEQDPADLQPLTPPQGLCLARGVCAGTIPTCAGGAGWTCIYPVEQYESGELETSCDGLDNSCDGALDNRGPGLECACLDGQTQACGSAVGLCRLGSQSCAGGCWGECLGAIWPERERCFAPGLPGQPNGQDEDCDGLVDEDDAEDVLVWYRDNERDGYGDARVSRLACTDPSDASTRFVSSSTDCNDAVNTTHPAASEFCDGVDNNCNGAIDEGVTRTYYLDADGDGHGNAQATTQACSVPAGYVRDNSDCNDGNRAVNPGATELCDRVDNNCRGGTDEGCACINGDTRTCGSNVGVCRQGTETCNINGAWSACTGGVQPSNEVCDGQDNDCDG